MGSWYQARWLKVCSSSCQGLLSDWRHRLWRTIFPSSSVWICENDICSHCPWALAYGSSRCQNSIPLWKAWWRNLHVTARGLHEKGNKTRVYQLNRAIYGLKQAALAWWKELEASMKWLGFTCLHSDAGVFHNKRLNIVVIAYDDDFLLAKINHRS